MEYYFEWLEETSGTLVRIKHYKDNYYIYFKHSNKPLLQLQRERHDIGDDIIQFKVVGGTLAVNMYEDNGILEFRRFIVTNEFMVHLFIYININYCVMYYLY